MDVMWEGVVGIICVDTVAGGWESCGGGVGCLGLG